MPFTKEEAHDAIESLRGENQALRERVLVLEEYRKTLEKTESNRKTDSQTTALWITAIAGVVLSAIELTLRLLGK